MPSLVKVTWTTTLVIKNSMTMGPLQVNDLFSDLSLLQVVGFPVVAYSRLGSRETVPASTVRQAELSGSCSIPEV